MAIKSYTTAAVALALSMSEVTIKEKFSNANTLSFTQICELREDKKNKKYDAEASDLSTKLAAFDKLMEG